jgi:hypothetical protein
MKKIIKLTIDIKANITEQITPALIEKRMDAELEHPIRIPEEALKKLQDVLSYILNHPDFYRDILVGDIFENQSNLGGYSQLGKYLRPKIFEDIAHTVGKEMGPDYETFIIELVNLRVAACAKRFYQETIKPHEQQKEMQDIFRVMINTLQESQIPLTQGTADCILQDEITEAEELGDFLMVLLLDCITTYKISGASLEEINTKKNQ